MLKSEDQEYKSRHLAADPACASNTMSDGASFGILTGGEGFVDLFELDDTRKGGEATIAMQMSTWGRSTMSRTA